MTAPRHKLIVTLPSDTEIKQERIFEAPRDLVFRAFTDPDVIPRWWGPHGFSTSVDVFDLRPGGKWRFVQQDTDGNEYAFRGEYREISPPERVLGTFEFEGMPGHIAVETTTLEEVAGGTLMTTISKFDSKEDRDGMLQSGMEQGAAETLDRLEALLPEMDVVS